MRPLTIVNTKQIENNMTFYSNFIGIDIGKFNFVVNTHGLNTTKEYENSDTGINDFVKDHEGILSNALCVLETTGGYEMKLLLTLCENKYATHRANTRKVKSFIRSYSNGAKTDALDAKGLARYGKERGSDLNLYVPPSENSMAMYELVTRRHDLISMRTAEKNRLKSPRANLVKKSCEAIIAALSSEVDCVTEEISTLIKQDADLTSKKEILQTVPGIGNLISNDFVTLLPELGYLSRRQIASLAGVAPRANDSGNYRGYRSTGHGRSTIKSSLFLAAMAARNSNSPLKAFYEQLIGRGKSKKVALTALMRKIIVIANARIKEVIDKKGDGLKTSLA